VIFIRQLVVACRCESGPGNCQEARCQTASVGVKRLELKRSVKSPSRESGRGGRRAGTAADIVPLHGQAHQAIDYDPDQFPAAVFALDRSNGSSQLHADLYRFLLCAIRRSRVMRSPVSGWVENIRIMVCP
jgi:hypothetical protein